MQNKKLYLLCLSICSSTAVFAGEDGSNAILDTISVIGTRTENLVRHNPYSVTVIKQDELAHQSTKSVAEILQDVPGVSMSEGVVAGMKKISIRGESSARVTILIDGQELTDHSIMGSPYLVDSSNIDRIELVRGPASVQYGAKAIGGVVNIITKKGAAKPFQFESDSNYFSASRGWKQALAASGTISNFDYRLIASKEKHHDRSVPASKYSHQQKKLEGTSYETANLSLHTGYRFGTDDNHYLGFKAEKSELKTQNWKNPAQIVFPIKSFSIDLPKRDRTKYGLYYDVKNLNDVVKHIHFDAYTQKVDREFINNVLMQPAPIMTVGIKSESYDKLKNYGTIGQIDLKLLDNHTTIFGLHYLSDQLDTTKLSTNTVTRIIANMPKPMVKITEDKRRTNAAINTLSLFAQDEWNITDSMKFNLGLRYLDINTKLKNSSNQTYPQQSKHDKKLLSSAGLVYYGFDNLVLRTAYSEGYITPTLLQMYTETTAGGRGTSFGNPNLKPETARNFELGLRFSNGNLTADSTIFHTHAKNYISSITCSMSSHCPATAQPNDSLYINANSANTYGLELQTEYTLADINMAIYANTTFIRRKEQYQSYSTYNTDTPKLTGRLGIKNQFNILGSNIWTDLNIRGGSNTKITEKRKNQLYTESLPSWLTLNFGTGINLGKQDMASLSLYFNNITNKKYQTGFNALPGAARSIDITGRLKF